MLKKRAYAVTRERLAAANAMQRQDVRDILRLGAGDLGLPDGATMTPMPGLDSATTLSCCSLVEGIEYSSQGEDWEPVRAGEWEAVLATLVVEGEWDIIATTARDLRASASHASLGRSVPLGLAEYEDERDQT